MIPTYKLIRTCHASKRPKVKHIWSPNYLSTACGLKWRHMEVDVGRNFDSTLPLCEKCAKRTRDAIDELEMGGK